jgi:hypothetical protein
VLNNVRYASDSDHSRYESELTLWAKSRHWQALSIGSSAVTNETMRDHCQLAQ